MMRFDTDFNIGDRVVIDGDETMTAIVTAFLFRGASASAECSWVSNGAPHSAWIETFRLVKQ